MTFCIFCDNNFSRADIVLHVPNCARIALSEVQRVLNDNATVEQFKRANRIVQNYAAFRTTYNHIAQAGGLLRTRSIRLNTGALDFSKARTTLRNRIIDRLKLSIDSPEDHELFDRIDTPQNSVFPAFRSLITAVRILRMLYIRTTRFPSSSIEPGVECTICRDSFEPGQLSVWMDFCCRTFFHLECITEDWLIREPKCAHCTKDYSGFI